MLVNRFFIIFNRISPVIIQTPWIATFGNCAEDLFWGLVKARDYNKKVFFIFPFELRNLLRFSKIKINKELLKIQSKYRFSTYNSFFSQFCCLLLTITFLFFRFINFLKIKIGLNGLSESYIIPDIGRSTLWNRENKNNYLFHLIKPYKWKTQLEKKLYVRMPNDSYLAAQKLRREMGIPQEDWFVCLHVREGGYYNFKEGIEKFNRNATPSNFIKGIKYINDKGGWVVRLGDSSMTKLPKIDKFIDYPHSKFKSDIMDIYLVQECRFLLCTVSGILPLAALFQKPIILTNIYQWNRVYPLKKGDLGILKHTYSNTEKRFIPLKEIAKKYAKNPKMFWSNEYSLFENTEDEILELLTEFMETPRNCKPSELQKEWEKLRVKAGHEIAAKEFDKVESYLFAACIEGCNGMLGQKFLENNWESDILTRKTI